MGDKIYTYSLFETRFRSNLNAVHIIIVIKILYLHNKNTVLNFNYNNNIVIKILYLHNKNTVLNFTRFCKLSFSHGFIKHIDF